MLSVANIAPGSEIEVTTTWAAALTFNQKSGSLRIPLTVGDIYGRSRLPDSDEFLTGGPIQTAELFIKNINSNATIRGAKIQEGYTEVPLNAPIDLLVSDIIPRNLIGYAADGREVNLQVFPQEPASAPLSVAVLIDHSGSMGEHSSAHGRSVTKHKAVLDGIRAVSDLLNEDDFIDFWQFDDEYSTVGSTEPRSENRSSKKDMKNRYLSLIEKLAGPSGGTEIGQAVKGVIDGSSARDILLITDGKSYEIDVQELARAGRRITVVLVGEDSLEANVGYLSALTGGSIFVAATSEIEDVIAAAMNSLRTMYYLPKISELPLQSVSAIRANAHLKAQWSTGTNQSFTGRQERAVAAFATGLALQMLSEESASTLAEQEGLITHLTSLVLVDDVGSIQEGIPAHRKIPLPAPSISYSQSMASISSSALVDYSLMPSVSLSRSSKISYDEDCYDREDSAINISPILNNNILKIASAISWDHDPTKLAQGDLSDLSDVEIKIINEVAGLSEIQELALTLNVTTIVLVIALMAQSQAGINRSAARIAKSILGTSPNEEANQAMASLGLQ